MEVEWWIPTVNRKYRVNDEWKVYEIERSYQKKKGDSVESSENITWTEVLEIIIPEIAQE
jgi:hypothetical protein